MDKHSPTIPGHNLRQFRVKPALVVLAYLISGFVCVSVPSVQGAQPWLQYTGAGGKAIGVSLSVYNTSVEIQGLLAETTIVMTFQNHEARVLEGELRFPLPEGSTVSGYGLDIDGALVEGVVVQKDKARRVFNTEVRKKVDPGLVSWTRGNQFKTRVYPIPAGGTRTVMVRYVSQIDGRDDDEAVYVLPKLPNRVDDFSLRIDVPQEHTRHRPKLRGALAGAGFARVGGRWVLRHRSRDVQLEQDVQVVLPRLPANIIHLNRHADNHTYFLVHDVIDRASFPSASPPPQRVALLWDASLSRHGDPGTEKELAFLAALLNEWGDGVQVDLTLLRDTADHRRAYRMANGGVESLLADLRAVAYDGGTDLCSMAAAHTRDADAVLLFSDGQHNMGGGLPEPSATPIFAITAQTDANFILLRHLATTSGGQFVNLGRAGHAPEEVAATVAGAAGLQFMGASALSGAIDSVFPRGQPLVRGRFAVTGRMSSPEATLELRYGRGGVVIHRTKVTLSASDASQDRLVTWYHAAQQVAELALFPDQNADALLALGRAHGLVTPQTSLLVLDTLEQHLQHDVEPARSRARMHAAWVQRKKEKREVEGAARTQHLEMLLNLWERKKAWHATDFGDAAGAAEAHHGAREAEAGAVLLESSEAYHVAREAAVPRAVRVAREVVVGDGTAPAGLRGQRRSAPTTTGASRRRTHTSTRTRRTATTAMAVPTTIDTLQFESFGSDFSGGGGGGGGGGGDDDEADEPHQNTMQDLDGAIHIKAWDPDTPYMPALKSAGGSHCATACEDCDRDACVPAAYKAYQTLRNRYASSPSFFLDVATWFYGEPGGAALGRRVLSSILELDLDDPSLLRIVAYRLAQAGDLDLAVNVLEDVLQMRPEEPQSHRDLALALARRGEGQQHRSAADLERAMALLHHVVMTGWSQFEEIQLIALTELNRLWARADAWEADRAGATKVSRPELDPRLVANMAVDLRVALSWDMDATDIDLWVIEPSGEKAYYRNKRTRLGGLVSRDFTQGYGPETYNLKQVVPGKYFIKANYYSSFQQKMVGPATIKATVFSNYGRENEVRKEITLRLDGIKQVVAVGELSLGDDNESHA